MVSNEIVYAAQWDNFEDNLVSEFSGNSSLLKVLVKTISLYFLRGVKCVVSYDAEVGYQYRKTLGRNVEAKFFPKLPSLKTMKTIRVQEGKLNFSLKENKSYHLLLVERKVPTTQGEVVSSLSIWINKEKRHAMEIDNRTRWLISSISRLNKTFQIVFSFLTNENYYQIRVEHAAIKRHLYEDFAAQSLPNVMALFEVLKIARRNFEPQIVKDTLDYIYLYVLHAIEFECFAFNHEAQRKTLDFLAMSDERNSLKEQSLVEQSQIWMTALIRLILRVDYQAVTLPLKPAEYQQPICSFLLFKVQQLFQEVSKQNWLAFVEQEPVLKKYIQLLCAEMPATKSNDVGLTVDRHIFRLIFCSEFIDFLCQWDNGRASEFELMEVKRALAYVLRETLRFVGMDVPHYWCQPNMFAEQLFVLVRFHAEHIVKTRFPAELCATLKAALHHQNRSKQRFALEHIQHITDVYITGFTLGHVKIRICDQNRGIVNECSLFDFLSAKSCSSISNTSCEQLQQSFALAAIFHDISMFDEFDLTVEQAIQTLVDNSILEELDTDQLKRFSNSFNQHSLISAAVFCQQMELQNELEAHMDEINNKQVIKSATNAILNHTTAQVPCEIGKFNDDDKLNTPAMFLLALLDDLLEWLPSTNLDYNPYRVANLSAGFNLGASAKNTLSAKELIQLAGVHYKPADDQSGGSCLTVDLIQPQEGEKPSFPTFHIQLSDAPQLAHRKLPTILILAQTFGRFCAASVDEQAFTWAPSAVVHVSESFEEVINNINRLAAKKEHLLSPRLHQLCDILNQNRQQQDESIYLKAPELPFGNMDVRDFLKAFSPKKLMISSAKNRQSSR